MANESASGRPLSATVGEQLAGKGHLDAVREAERSVGAEAHSRGRARAGSAHAPWVALAAGAAAWLLARRVERLLRRR